jgi:hypothetical protein
MSVCIRTLLLCEISCSHGCNYEHCFVLTCDACAVVDGPKVLCVCTLKSITKRPLTLLAVLRDDFSDGINSVKGLDGICTQHMNQEA